MSGERYRLTALTKLRNARRDMQKNLDDMDLDNLDVKDQMQEIVDTMIGDIDTTASKISSYHFEDPYGSYGDMV
jgi:hypothetical protein